MNIKESGISKSLRISLSHYKTGAQDIEGRLPLLKERAGPEFSGGWE